MQTLTKVVLVASLLAWLAGCGLQTSTGVPVASGKVWFFDPGTNVPQTVWADSTESETITQPVILDAAGRATVYTKNTVDIVVEDSSGASLGTLGNANDIPAAEVTVDPSVSAGPHLSDALTAGLGSFGAPDFQYQDSPGATPMNVGAWMSSVQINVKAFGAKGDGLAIDTTAIQKAINRVKALGGGIVYFPPGTYLIDNALAVTSGTGIVLLGAGIFASIIKQTNGAASGIVFTGGAAGCAVRSMQITHANVSTVAAVQIGGAPSSTLEVANISVPTGKFRYGVWADLTGLLSIHDSNIQGAGAVVDAASRAILVTNSNSVRITENQLTNAGGTVIDLNAVGDYSIYGNALSSNATGISLTSCSKGTVVANPSLGFFGIPFIVVTSDAGFTQFGNMVDGQTVNVASGGTVTPNQYLGDAIRIQGTSVGLAFNIAVPTIAPTRRGYRLYFHLFNNAGAPVTGWTFAAGYRRSATAISLLDGHHTMLVFEYDLDAAMWREVSISDTT